MNLFDSVIQSKLLFIRMLFPTLEGKILASSFGTPEIFRAAQNTTCYVRLNIKIRLEKQVNFIRILLILDGWLHITNSSITQQTIQPHDHPISQTFLHSLNQSVGNIYYGNNRQTKVDGRRSLALNFGARQK